MAFITRTQDAMPEKPEPKFDLDVAAWLKSNIFNSPWKITLGVILLAANILIIQLSYRAAPVGLSFNLAPEGQPTTLGQLILTLTDGALLTTVILILWLVGAITMVYCAARRRWPGPTQWFKDSLYTGPFGALITLALSLIIIFAIRGLLSWTIFGAEFRSDPQIVSMLRPETPGAIWGIVIANQKLFAVGQYPTQALWRVWASLGIVLGLSVFSLLAWSLGSPLKRFRTPLVWAWLASIVVIFLLLRGVGPMEEVGTNLWGGFLLTVVLSVVGILVSFPIGVILALGRRSEVRGVPVLWLWGIIVMILYWIFGSFPTEPVTLHIPILFRQPPIWIVTLSPLIYALLQAVLVVGLFWVVGYYLQGNLIKTISIAYIELIRGVPLITVLFMAQILLPIFLPKGIEIDNLLRVTVGIILFSAAYLAENVRGGLQAIPHGQYEAAMAIGLNTPQSMRLIILPQALRAVIPAMVGQFITLFKDTSLVAIVGLFDLLKIAQVVVAQPDWLGLQQETFAFVALVYWIFSFAMSQASQELERKLGVGQY